MQFIGIMILVAGYSCLYTAAEMLKRPPGGESGSVLYWMTGIDSLGAPSGSKPGATGGTSGGGTRNAKGTTTKNSTLPGKGIPPTATKRGTHG